MLIVSKMPIWNINSFVESSKLTNEQGWKLASSDGKVTSRTRNGGTPKKKYSSGLPALAIRRDDSDEESSCASSTGSMLWNSDMEAEDSDSDDEWEEEDETTKPPATRVILEVDSIMDMMKKNSCCPQCESALATELETTCIATSIVSKCVNPECTCVYHSQRPAGAKLPDSPEDDRNRSTNHAVNVLYILGFLSMGDGCTEAARLLGLLGLPNDTTMESRSFTIIEERLGPAIRGLCKDILNENLTEEARMCFEESASQDANDFAQWQQALSDPSFKLSIAKYPSISMSFDMGWQQRGSQQVYNSPSGHAVMVGKHYKPK